MENNFLQAPSDLLVHDVSYKCQYSGIFGSGQRENLSGDSDTSLLDLAKSGE
jgi:predicted nucleotidyltransferase